MADLRNSRGKFFEKHKMPRNESFWLHFLKQIGLSDQLSPEAVAACKSWKPERSNCPELTEVLEGFIERVPPEYKALARNLFVGRVIAGEVNAQAWTERKSGVIEISIQYMYVLTAYSAAFDEFCALIRNVFTKIKAGDSGEIEERLAEIEDRFREPWDMLDDYRDSWFDPNLLVGGNVALLGRSASDRRDLQANLVSNAEAWIIAHELSHHLLGHTVSRRDKRSAKLLIDKTIAEAGLEHHLSRLNTNQKQEIQADILGFLIAADCIEKPVRFRSLYGSLGGLAMALLSVAHITHQWLDTEPDATHPGFLQRYVVIHDLVVWLTKDLSFDPVEGHPLGLLGQLSKFSGVALKYRISQALPDETLPDVLSVVSSFIEYENEIFEKYFYGQTDGPGPLDQSKA